MKDSLFFQSHGKQLIKPEPGSRLPQYVWWLNGKSNMTPQIQVVFNGSLIQMPANMFCALGKNDQKDLCRARPEPGDRKDGSNTANGFNLASSVR